MPTTTKKAKPEMSMSEACTTLGLPRSIGYELYYAGFLAGRRNGSRYCIDPGSVEALQRLRVQHVPATLDREED